jgi:hypothetical protein
MFIMFHTTEPVLSAPIRAILEQVVGLVSKGYYSYAVTLGPDGDMPAFELEMKNWVEEVKRKTAMTHPLEDLQYLSLDRFCFLMATPGLNDVLADCRVRLEDIRKKPIPCIGYKVSCEKLAEGHSVLVNGMSGKRLDFLSRYTAGSSGRLVGI